MGQLTSFGAVGVLVASLIGNFLAGIQILGQVAPLSTSVAPDLAAAVPASGADECSLARECLQRLEQYHGLRVTLALSLGGLGWLAAACAGLCYLRPRARASSAAAQPAVQAPVVGVSAAGLQDFDALDLDHYVPRRA